MKNAPAACSNESALNKRKDIIGALPKRFDTMQALVLAALIDGSEPVTAYSAYMAGRVKSIRKVIHSIEKELRWPVERVQVKQVNRRGEEVAVIGYKLPQATLASAQALYGSFWVDLVSAFRDLHDHANNQRVILMLKREFAALAPQNEVILQKFARLLGVM